MLLPRKWALSLGLLAAVPALAMAGPTDEPKPQTAEQTAAAAEAASKSENQAVAEAIAKALGKEKLQHKNVQIEVNGGTARISGMIKDSSQRDTVTRVVSTVPGVKTVDNKLVAMETATAAAPVQQAAVQQPASAPARQVQPINFDQPPASNQAVAQKVADSLSAAGLSGYDIEVRCMNGEVSLMGRVEDQEQVARAYRAAAGVPGVSRVHNQLNSARGGAVQPAGYPQMPMAPQGQPIQQMQGMSPAQMPAPPYGHVQPAGGHMIHNQPSLPEYAWPSYAPYDNSAAVTYPSMYDASAWPYIGPYYPYPQVPLGWRESKLTWKDGNWNLQFSSRTDRWWWFLSPKNWHE